MLDAYPVSTPMLEDDSVGMNNPPLFWIYMGRRGFKRPLVAYSILCMPLDLISSSTLFAYPSLLLTHELFTGKALNDCCVALTGPDIMLSPL